MEVTGTVLYQQCSVIYTSNAATHNCTGLTTQSLKKQNLRYSRTTSLKQISYQWFLAEMTVIHLPTDSG